MVVVAAAAWGARPAQGGTSKSTMLEMTIMSPAAPTPSPMLLHPKLLHLNGLPPSPRHLPRNHPSPRHQWLTSSEWMMTRSEAPFRHPLRRLSPPLELPLNPWLVRGIQSHSLRHGADCTQVETTISTISRVPLPQPPPPTTSVSLVRLPQHPLRRHLFHHRWRRRPCLPRRCSLKHLLRIATSSACSQVPLLQRPTCRLP